MSRQTIKVNVFTDIQNIRSDRRFKMTEPNTKDRILDSAEYLFANKGLKETSVRDITSQADVHLAAVNYHFKTKDGLLKALIDRRMKPLNSQRLELLNNYEKRFGKGSIPLEHALYALMAPGVRMCFVAPDFMKITGQVVSHPDQETFILFIKHFEGIFTKFKVVFAASLPHLSDEELMWRMHFLTGAMIHACTNDEGLKSLSGGTCVLNDKEVVINKLISFSAAGLRADIYNHPKE